jgi:hypothetical protein
MSFPLKLGRNLAIGVFVSRAQPYPINSVVSVLRQAQIRDIGILDIQKALIVKVTRPARRQHGPSVTTMWHTYAAWMEGAPESKIALIRAATNGDGRIADQDATDPATRGVHRVQMRLPPLAASVT